MLTRQNEFTFSGGPFVDRKTVLAVVCLFIALLLVYSNSFQGDWHFDDFHNIVDNPNVHLQTLRWDDLKESFYGVTYGTDGQRLSRPLAFATFALNYFFSGTDVLGYHVVNFLIHFSAALFLFLLVRTTLTGPIMKQGYGDIAHPVALVSAFLWATSPLQVHAVTIVVQRMASLAGLGYVVSLYFYARARTSETPKGMIAYYALSGVGALAAFATKENSAVLPLALLLYDFFFIQGISADSAKRVLRWAVLPIAVVIGLGLIYTDFSLQAGTYEAGVRPFTAMERLLTQTRILFFYISLLLYPIPSRLALLHDIDISRGLFDPWTTIVAIASIILCVFFAAWKARTYPLFSFAVLFFLLNHLVEGTIIPLELIFEHRNYIPSMFFFVPIAAGMIRCLDYFSYRRSLQYFLAAGFALLLIFQGQTTFERNDIVRSDIHLWLDNVRKSPYLSRPHINLAKHYYEAGMYEKACHELKTAEELNRDTNLRQIGLASYNLGLYYFYQAKDIDRAEQQFMKALERFPGLASAVVGLAHMRLEKKDVEGAWDLMKAYGSRHPRDSEMLTCYALVLLKKGDAAGAIKAAAQSMALKWGNPQAWEISGAAWGKMGQWQRAAQCWEEARRLNPSNPRAQLALVELYDRMNDSRLGHEVMRCLSMKGADSLDDWLAGLARSSRVSAFEVNKKSLDRIIRREVHREFGAGRTEKPDMSERRIAD